MHVSLGTKSPAVVLGCLVKGIVGEFQELDIMLFFALTLVGINARKLGVAGLCWRWSFSCSSRHIVLTFLLQLPITRYCCKRFYQL